MSSGGTGYAIGIVLEEIAARAEAVVAPFLLPVPSPEGESGYVPDPQPPTVYVGVAEGSIAPGDWPALIINADSGRSGAIKWGDDRRAVIRLTLAMYMRESSDFSWVARVCDALCMDLLTYERVAGESTTLGGKDNIIKWQTLDDVEMPLAAGQVLCEVRLPVVQDTGL
jgi:hypothetical protein